MPYTMDVEITNPEENKVRNLKIEGFSKSCFCADVLKSLIKSWLTETSSENMHIQTKWE